jgi:hypothetical protein
MSPLIAHSPRQEPSRRMWGRGGADSRGHSHTHTLTHSHTHTLTHSHTHILSHSHTHTLTHSHTHTPHLRENLYLTHSHTHTPHLQESLDLLLHHPQAHDMKDLVDSGLLRVQRAGVRGGGREILWLDRGLSLSSRIYHQVY